MYVVNVYWFFLSHNRSEKLNGIVCVGTCEFEFLFSSSFGNARVCSVLSVCMSVELDLLERHVVSCTHVDTKGKGMCIFRIVLWKSLCCRFQQRTVETIPALREQEGTSAHAKRTERATSCLRSGTGWAYKGSPCTGLTCRGSLCLSAPGRSCSRRCAEPVLVAESRKWKAKSCW